MTTSEARDRSNRDRTYSITELCREFDVTPRTLRFYEQKGLLHPARRGWTRLFSYRDRARLQLILRGKKVGFALEEIKEMLDLYNLRDGQLTQLRIASTKMRERLEALRKQRVELEDAIADLERTVVVVDGMLKEREAAGTPQGAPRQLTTATACRYTHPGENAGCVFALRRIPSGMPLAYVGNPLDRCANDRSDAAWVRSRSGARRMRSWSASTAMQRWLRGWASRH